MRVRNFIIYIVPGIFLLLYACSNQKNTKTTRAYHEINTRYNIYFNAENAYNEALERKLEGYEDNLSEIIYVTPYFPADTAATDGGKTNNFETVIDKSVKAIRLHSIQAKPERDPKKKKDETYQAWLKQKEYNPFLKNVWLMMAKAEFQDKDYFRAISSFSYISRTFKNEPDVVAESRLWIAKAYIQMGWLFEAENVLKELTKNQELPKSQQELYTEVYADLLVHTKRYEEAIPYITEAIKGASGLQKTRLKFLLGQVYAETGQKEQAYEAFGNVSGLGVPYEYSLNAQLKQTGFAQTGTDRKKALSSLEKMVKQSKNENYLDQVYYAKGNLHWLEGDTAKTIECYRLGVDKSMRGGYDKAMVALALADIYFDRKEYIPASPLYSEALGILEKKYSRYGEISQRAEALEELVVHLEAIHLQDSLQTLARMPEEERLMVINQIIKDLKKREEEERKLALLEEHLDNTRPIDDSPIVNRPSTMRDEASTFYFYNNQSVAQGKTTFRNRWGNRKLEDNWRRKNKSITLSFDEETYDDEGEDTEIDGEILPQEEGEEVVEAVPLSDDPYSPEYYIQQLPLTEQALKESNNIIEEALYESALIYKDKLEDLYQCIEAFDTTVSRFPRTEYLEEIYYQLFLVYSQLGNKNMAEIYRGKLINEFPQGEYAITLSDPNYEWNMYNMATLENNLYDETYDAYLSNRVTTVRNNYEQAKQKYPLTKLMPKFMFLNAMSYVTTNEQTEVQNNLKELVEKYPTEDVSVLAMEILEGLKNGRMLAADGSGMRGMVWNLRFGEGDAYAIDSTTVFTDNRQDEQLLLFIYEPSIDKNLLQYDVANFNFSNFILQTFDITFSQVKGLEMLQVRGFDSFENIQEYVEKALQDTVLMEQLDPTILLIPISSENYTVLTAGKSLGEYLTFFADTYRDEIPVLIRYWEKQLEEDEEEEIPSETIVVEEKQPQENIPPSLEKEEEEKSIVEEMQPKEEEKAIDPKTQVIPDRFEWRTQETTTEKEEEKNTGANIRIDETKKDIQQVIDNPIDGIKNILQPDNKVKLTKEEKEALKEEQKIEKELQKERAAIEKARTDSLRQAEKEQQNAVRNAEKEQKELERAAIKAKEDAKKNAAKEKEDARKAKERERKEKAKERQERLKQQEKERKEKLKQREQERKEKQRQREQERKEKERLAREKKKNK